MWKYSCPCLVTQHEPTLFNNHCNLNFKQNKLLLRNVDYSQDCVLSAVRSMNPITVIDFCHIFLFYVIREFTTVESRLSWNPLATEFFFGNNVKMLPNLLLTKTFLFAIKLFNQYQKIKLHWYEFEQICNRGFHLNQEGYW